MMEEFVYCETCKYWSELSAYERGVRLGRLGTCYRHPPTATGDRASQRYHQFPVTNDDSFCGEHTKKGDAS